MAVSLNTTKGKKGEFVIKKLAPRRSKDVLLDLLRSAAKEGTQALFSLWKKLSVEERQLLGNACPAEIKQSAADVDSAVPKNIDTGDQQ